MQDIWGRGEVNPGFWWGRPERKKPFGRPRRRWEDNIKLDLEKWDGDMDWVHLVQDTDRWRALVSAVMNVRVT